MKNGGRLFRTENGGVSGPDGIGASANRRPLATLGRLLLKNRSHRGYDARFVVRGDQLRRIIGVNARNPLGAESTGAALPARTGGRGSQSIGLISGWEGTLPELHLPLPGTEPNAFIIICSTVRRGPLCRYRSGHFGSEHAAAGGRNRVERHLHRSVRQGADPAGVPIWSAEPLLISPSARASRRSS